MADILPMQDRAFSNLIDAMQISPIDISQSLTSLEFSRPEHLWDALSLKRLLHGRLHSQQVIVVSNREPYIHHRNGDSVGVTQPPSGLVTALEPVLMACRGTWIAHGSGNADAENVDAEDTCRVPPGVENYTLRRVWLSAAEQVHYLDGFSNQGLWPLCHLANQAPVFRVADWQSYQRVNRRFAQAVVQESCQDDPIVLVQDYHLALLPALIRTRLPRATVISFWHIPWPSPTVLSACPWQRELLNGMLGSSIVGLQTEVDRRHFLAAVENIPGGSVNHETSSICTKRHTSLARSYPISIAWPQSLPSHLQKPIDPPSPTVLNIHRAGNASWCLPADGKRLVSVDRFDYTKGFMERMRALELLLVSHPEWVGKVTLVQVAAPTRSSVPAYALFQAQVIAEVARINRRFSQTYCLRKYRPINLLANHHDRGEVDELYRSADVCVVTSLHDGMNLVAKEFVASRNDETGVLVLSKFAGAAAELREALLINPHNLEQTANTLLRAITMPLSEQTLRMSSMRSTVRHANIYRWAGTMLQDAAHLREQQDATLRTPSDFPAQSAHLPMAQRVEA